MLSTFTLATVTGPLAVELMLQLHNKGNKVTTYSKATQWYGVNWLTFSRRVAEPRRFVTELDLLLDWPKLRRQWSVKCFAQTGSFPETIQLSHCFFRGLDEGIKNRLVLIWTSKHWARHSHGPSSFSHGQSSSFLLLWCLFGSWQTNMAHYRHLLSGLELRLRL